jgi:hypothetical protein
MVGNTTRHDQAAGVAAGAPDRRGHLLPVADWRNQRARRGHRQGGNAGIIAVPPLQLAGPGRTSRRRPNQAVRARDRLDPAVAAGIGDPAGHPTRTAPTRRTTASPRAATISPESDAARPPSATTPRAVWASRTGPSCPPHSPAGLTVQRRARGRARRRATGDHDRRRQRVGRRRHRPRRPLAAQVRYIGHSPTARWKNPSARPAARPPTPGS